MELWDGRLRVSTVWLYKWRGWGNGEVGVDGGGGVL